MAIQVPVTFKAISPYWKTAQEYMPTKSEPENQRVQMCETVLSILSLKFSSNKRIPRTNNLRFVALIN